MNTGYESMPNKDVPPPLQEEELDIEEAAEAMRREEEQKAHDVQRERRGQFSETLQMQGAIAARILAEQEKRKQELEALAERFEHEPKPGKPETVN